MTAHPKLTVSGMHRWMRCPASVRAEAQLPDTLSRAEEESGAAHLLAETCLSRGDNAEAYVNDEMIGYADHPVTEDMADAVQVYLNYVRAVPGTLHIEPNVDLSPWVQGGYATTDAIVVRGITAHVVDLNYTQQECGRAEDNPELMLYALGAMNTFRSVYAIKTFKTAIVQPRRDHISEASITIEDLYHFGESVKACAAD
ncbi:MAG: DUF2800 domain-containing protein, partial [Pseudomonadota bacterium]